MSATIEIADVGPVVEFQYAMDAPGLHVLIGDHGSGKSTVLRTMQELLGERADVRPTKRDGAKRWTAEFAGKTIAITAQRITEDGELTIDGLGDLNIAELHTPRFDKADTRDKHRIRALLRLAGAKADASLFHRVFGDGDRGKELFEKYVPADACKTDDLVEMWAKVKRALEKHALDYEMAERTETARAQAARQIAEGVDLAREDDAGKLADQLAASLEMLGRVKQSRASGLTTLEKATQARERLAALPPAKMSVNEATEALDAANAKLNAAADRVLELKRQLEEARGFAAICESGVAAALDAIQSAKTYAMMRGELEQTIAQSANVECPNQAEVDAASLAVEQAKQAQAVGVAVRQAKEAARKAEEHAKLAKHAAKMAQGMRDAAAETQDVLSDAIASIPNCPIRVNVDDDGNARLVLATDRSEAERFDELSDGERWPIIIGLAAARNKLIVLPQAAFGELSDATRDLLDRLAKQHECYILTAKSVHGEALRGEAWKAGELAVAAA